MRGELSRSFGGVDGVGVGVDGAAVNGAAVNGAAVGVKSGAAGGDDGCLSADSTCN
jgi:hypothetical protein